MVTRLLSATGFFRVTVDETKFTPEFFDEFSRLMFFVDTVEDCIEHLASMYARGVIDGSTKYIEGYGSVAEMGIKFEAANGARDWIDADVHIEFESERD